jgi:hypothetical protein
MVYVDILVPLLCFRLVCYRCGCQSLIALSGFIVFVRYTLSDGSAADAYRVSFFRAERFFF